MNSKLDKLASALILLWIGIEVGRAFGRDAGYMEAVTDEIDAKTERDRLAREHRQDFWQRQSHVYNRGWSAEIIVGGIGLAVVIILGLYYVQ